MAGETPPEQGGASGAGVPPAPQRQESSAGSGSASPEPEGAPKAPPEAGVKPTPPNPEHGKPQHLSHELPKLVRRRSRSGHLMSVIDDIQRLPTDVIHQEFNRLLGHAQGQIKEVAEQPCMDMADRLKDCLYHNRQQACECFPVMDQYRQCVVRATQSRVDDKAESEPRVMIPMVPPRPMPRPEKPPECCPCPKRSWWRVWTWFK